MKLLYQIKKILSEIFCGITIAMILQIIIILLLSIPCFWDGRLVDQVLDLVYVPSACRIGMMFFEDQMFLGNIPLGILLIFFAFFYVSIIAGVSLYLCYRFYWWIRCLFRHNPKP